MIIRPFEPADGRFCHGLRRQAFLEIFSLELDDRAVKAGAEAYDPEEFGRLIGAMDSFVAMEGPDRVGFCTVRYPGRRVAEILYVYVDPGRLGQGIGTRLVNHAERWVNEKHPEVTSVVLDTAVPDYNQKFYENLGYSELGQTVCRYPAGEVGAIRLIKRVKQ
jgi:GNAT superfamily N-acetyltransferase